MTELFERFVAAVEKLASASMIQAELYKTLAGSPAIGVPQAEGPPPIEETAQIEGPAPEPVTDPVPEPAPEKPKATGGKGKGNGKKTAPAPEPEVEITDTVLNQLLRSIANHPKLSLETAKETFSANSGGAARIAEMDAALFPKLFKACKEVLDAVA